MSRFFYLWLQEEGIFCPIAPVHGFKFLFMENVSLIVEELGTFGAALDAGIAFDADAGNRGYIRRVNGSHRADSGANAAVHAFRACYRLDLADIYAVAFSVARLIVACVRVT